MLAYENITPGVTLAKLNNRERQTYPNRKLKGSTAFYENFDFHYLPSKLTAQYI